MPVVTLNFKETSAAKPLCEEDFFLLARTNFEGWKTYVTTRYLRTELDIRVPRPELGKVQEEESSEEPVSVVPEEERQAIMKTRNRLAAWFGQ